MFLFLTRHISKTSYCCFMMKQMLIEALKILGFLDMEQTTSSLCNRRNFGTLM